MILLCVIFCWLTWHCQYSLSDSPTLILWRIQSVITEFALRFKLHLLNNMKTKLLECLNCILNDLRRIIAYITSSYSISLAFCTIIIFFCLLPLEMDDNSFQIFSNEIGQIKDERMRIGGSAYEDGHCPTHLNLLFHI